MNKLFAFSLTLAFAAASSYGSTIFWANNLAPTTLTLTNLGTLSHSFLDDTNTFSLNATSLDITNMPLSATVGTTTVNPTFTTSANLGYKREADEWGLGIMTNTDAEIRLGYALQIDLSAYSMSGVGFTIDSLDSNEGFRIWGSTTANGQMTLLATGNGSAGFTQTLSLNPGAYKFYDITSNTPNNSVSSLVLRSVSASSSTPSSVPEPASLSAMGLGLAIMGGLLFSKKQSNRS
jgi:hypothetical protein